MVSYCTYAEIQRATGTALDQTTVEELITEAEVEVEGMVTAMGKTPSSSNTLLKSAVKFFTRAHVARRERDDGTKPNSKSTGAFSQSVNVDASIKDYEDKAARLVELYLKAANGNPYSQSDEDFEATIVREDHEMPSYNFDQSKVKEYHDQADETSNQDDDNGTGG